MPAKVLFIMFTDGHYTIQGPADIWNDQRAFIINVVSVWLFSSRGHPFSASTTVKYLAFACMRNVCNCFGWCHWGVSLRGVIEGYRSCQTNLFNLDRSMHIRFEFWVLFLVSLQLGHTIQLAQSLEQWCLGGWAGRFHYLVCPCTQMGQCEVSLHRGICKIFPLAWCESGHQRLREIRTL